MGKIQIKRGLAKNLPQSASIAELLYTSDDKRLFIGNGDNADLTEFKNANQIQELLNGKANSTHSHPSTDIDDFDSAVDNRINLKKGVANGLATLDSNGKIPSTQIPTEFKEAAVVNNIAARDALDAFTGLHALVIDASSDSTVETGGAEYVYNGTAWIKVSELNDLDAVITWDNVLNKPYFVQKITDLTDTPNSLSGQGGKVLAVNSAGTAIEFISVYTGDIDGGSF